jgi:hypothetical protein
MKPPSTPLSNSVRGWAFDKNKRNTKKTKYHGKRQKYPLSPYQSRCTHGSVFFFVTPSSHGLTRTENLGRRAATRSRASKLAQAQRQGKEARREGAQPRPRRRRGFHQARRQPRGKHGRHGLHQAPDTGHRGVGVGSAGGATSTSPDAGHGPSAGVVASFSPDEQRPWKEVIPDLECPCFHRFRWEWSCRVN